MDICICICIFFALYLYLYLYIFVFALKIDIFELSQSLSYAIGIGGRYDSTSCVLFLCLYSHLCLCFSLNYCTCCVLYLCLNLYLCLYLNCRNRRVMLSALVADMTALPLQSLKPQAISLHWLFIPLLLGTWI